MGRNGEHQSELPDRLDGIDINSSAQWSLDNRPVRESVRRDIFIRDSRKIGLGHFLKIVQGFFAQNSQFHQVRRVVISVEVDQLFPQFSIVSRSSSERRQITSPKHMKRMLRIGGISDNLINPATVIFQIFLVL